MKIQCKKITKNLAQNLARKGAVAVAPQIVATFEVPSLYYGKVNAGS